jgi:GDPmannose 4,6-dehydratase
VLDMKKALICGVSGQDGTYLAKFLILKGYQVFGGSRDAESSNFENHLKLGIRSQICYVSISLNDFRSVLQVIMKVQPDEIYNLAGQTSVALSFQQPVETLESISVGTLNILEAIRFSQLPIKFYNAGSSECFGNVDFAVNEETPFRPRSPYGVAKATSFWEVVNYREAYKIFACTGILFNHESPLRKERFVTKKIVSAACRIAGGSDEKLSLGNINIQRDWGWAPEYVEAMWLMLKQEQANDFIVATGSTISLKQFIIYVFEYLNLDWQEHVIFDDNLLRPTDIEKGLADPAKAKNVLQWEAKIKSEILTKKMVDCELQSKYE